MPTSVMKFVDRSSKITPRKRKQNRHACEDCRVRKKRCPHDFYEAVSGQPPPATPRSAISTSSGVASDSTVQVSSRAPLIPQQSNRIETSTQPHGQDPPVGQSAFHPRASSIYLSPESDTDGPWVQRPSSSNSASINVGRSSARSSPGPESIDRPEFVGHLNPEGIFLAASRLGASRASRYDDTLGFWLPRKRSRQSEDAPQCANCQPEASSNDPDVARPHTISGDLRRMALLPDAPAFNALRSIYFADIHPLFPILRPEIMPELEASSQPSHKDILLMQALCLAIASNPKARQYLRFQNSGDMLTPKVFASRLSRAINSGLDAIGSVDRLISVRIFAILSLFSQLSTDNHTAAEYCARAVSYMHTLQLHLDTTRFRKDDAVATQVFLCVWALDRLNAAFHSRPSLIHARDIGRDMEVSITRQEGPFRALLTICDLLEKITDLYRPSNKSGENNDEFVFPSFEDLLVKADAVRCRTHLLATIETLYHAVAMLSYRFHNLEDPDRSSNAYLRSNLSADRLITMMGTGMGNRLSNLPFVPYALSHALRLSYRELRLSKSPLYRSMARSRVLTVCGLLEKFGDSFAFARRMASLATKTVEEMDKVATSMLQERRNETDNAQSLRSERHRDQSSATDRDLVSNATVNESSMPNDLNVVTSMTENPDFVETFGVPQSNAIQSFGQCFDLLHQIPDLPDLFERFDPEFNLDAVDLALAQNTGAFGPLGLGLGPDFDWMSSLDMSNGISRDSENYQSQSLSTW